MLSYKKPSFWLIAVVLVIAVVVGFGLFADPMPSKPDDNVNTGLKFPDFSGEKFPTLV